MRRFYIPDLPAAASFLLPEEESKHIVRVLRMQQGDVVLLLNGKGENVTAQITDAHPKRCEVQVVSRNSVEQSNHFHLAIAPTKNSDRMEWLVEKMVEIGATDLTLLICSRSERAKLNIERLERVAISAMKQAQHDYLLRIHDLTAFTSFVAQHPNGKIAFCGDESKLALQESDKNGPVLIGPEGDFTEEEVLLAKNNGYDVIHLGTSRLRTETAGLVATTLAIHQI